MFDNIGSDGSETSSEKCIKYLTNTVPLFEKVIKNTTFNPKEPIPPLSVSLILFQKISKEDFTVVIDYVTILESIVCNNENSIRRKLASRTSMLIEDDTIKRKALSEYLEKVYKVRNNMVLTFY